MKPLAHDASGWPIHVGTYVEVKAAVRAPGSKARKTYAWVLGVFEERPGILRGECASRGSQLLIKAAECIVRKPTVFATSRRIGHAKSVQHLNEQLARQRRRPLALKRPPSD